MCTSISSTRTIRPELSMPSSFCPNALEHQSVSKALDDARSHTADAEVAANPHDTAPAFSTDPFVPRRFLRNGHLQTITGNFLPRTDRLPRPVPELVEVSSASDSHAATRVLC